MKLLVIQKKKIGDVLTSAVIFEAIKEKHPNWELHYLVNSNTMAVIKNNPFIDKFIIVEDKILKSKIEFIKFLFKIRSEKYDIVIDSFSTLKSIIIGRFSGAKMRISFDKFLTNIFYTHSIKRNTASISIATKAVEHRLILLKPIGIDFKVIKPKIFLSDEEKNNAKKSLIEAGLIIDNPIVMISAIGSDETKTYPLNYMAKVINSIAKYKQVQILLNYIPFQKNEINLLYNLCEKDTQNKIFIDFYQNDLRQFIAVTSCCKALIGNEGGATNMAKAIDVPTFTIFSPGILKNDWNMFENDTTNISVHPNDYSQTKTAKNDIEKYKLFLPEFFENKLSSFINFNLK